MTRALPPATGRAGPASRRAVAACLLAAALPCAAADLPQGTLTACTWELPLQARALADSGSFGDTMLKMLADDLGLPLRTVVVPFDKRVPAVSAGQCDVAVASAAGRDGSAAPSLHRSPALAEMPLRALVLTGQRQVLTWADLDRPGRRIGVARGGVASVVLPTQLRQASVVAQEVERWSLDDLESGRLDAMVLTKSFAERIARASRAVRLIAPPPDAPVWPITFLAPPSRPQWARRLDDFTERVKADGRLRRAAEAAGLATTGAR